jgi:hypothetical protein
VDHRPTPERRDRPPTPDPPPAPPAGKSGGARPPKVSELSGKLGQQAKRDPKFRSSTLDDRISRDDVLTAVWWLVLAKDGAPGVDGGTCQDIIEGPGATASPDERRDELRTTRSRPRPVKRVYIPKPDGRLRPVGIPICRSYYTSLQGGLGFRRGPVTPDRNPEPSGVGTSRPAAPR